jgi:hypothetical protein
MTDSLSKAERYQKEANRYGELAKSASPAFLGDLYRRVAIRYVFMAEDVLRRGEKDGDRISKRDGLFPHECAVVDDPTKVTKVERTVKEPDITLEESFAVILQNAALSGRMIAG